MQSSRKISRTAIAAVAAVVLAAPVAGASPMYDGSPSRQAANAAADRAAYTPDHPSADMHASTTAGTPSGTTLPGGDLRGEATRLPSGPALPGGDLRGEATRLPSGPTAGTADIVPGDLRGEAAKPMAPVEVVAAGDGDDPVDWPLFGLILAGTLALAGATFVLGRRTPGHAH